MPRNLDVTYRTQGVDHTGHCGVIVLSLLLDRRISNVEFELRRGVILAVLGAAQWSDRDRKSCTGVALQASLTLSFCDGIER